MQKLNAKKLIRFRGLSSKGKGTFVVNLKKEAPLKKESGGGDYWICATSAIGHAWERNDNRIIQEKMDWLMGQIQEAPHQGTKTMYGRNITMLAPYSRFDFSKLRPKKGFEAHGISKRTAPILLRGLPVQIIPNYYFTFPGSEKTEVGVLWLVAQQAGFRKEELVIFVELAHRYLAARFGRRYLVNPRYCIVLDVVSGVDFRFSDLLVGKAEPQVDKTLNELNALLRK
jgi:hypothetical protein